MLTLTVRAITVNPKAEMSIQSLKGDVTLLLNCTFVFSALVIRRASPEVTHGWHHQWAALETKRLTSARWAPFRQTLSHSRGPGWSVQEQGETKEKTNRSEGWKRNGNRIILNRIYDDSLRHDGGLSAVRGGALWRQQGRSVARWWDGREKKGRASTKPTETVIRVYYHPWISLWWLKGSVIT